MFKGKYLEEAQDIFSKASAFKVPPRNGVPLFVEYVVDKMGLFATINLLPVGTGYIGPYETKPVIDMGFPRQQKNYDKLGYKNLLKVMRGVLFGEKRTRLTRDRCEEFFDDPENFAILTSKSAQVSSIQQVNLTGICL